MKNLTFTVLIVLSFASCSSFKTNSNALSNRDISKIKNIMSDQQKAWNEGDIESFMSAYLYSDSLVFIGSRGLNYGWQTTLDNYKKSYQNKDQMGRLLFENGKIDQISPNSIWVAGRWNLFRSSDTLQGSYLLVWEKLEEEWKIVADHSS